MKPTTIYPGSLVGAREPAKSVRSRGESGSEKSVSFGVTAASTSCSFGATSAATLSERAATSRGFEASGNSKRESRARRARGEEEGWPQREQEAGGD